MARSRRKYQSSQGVQEQNNDNPNKKSKRNMVLTKPMSKKLAKKERKRLEKIVDRKNKKNRRSELLANLAKVQVKPEELAMFGSIAHLGTKNSRISALSKRPINEELKTAIEDASKDPTLLALKGWTGKRKKRKLEKKDKPPLPKVVEESSSDSSSSDQEDDDNDDNEVSSKDVEMSEKENEVDETERKENDSPQTTDVNMEESNENQKENVKISDKKVVKTPSKPAIYIHLDRSDKIQESRLRLPILAEEQVIMETISENPIVIICGETGSGKTTQVPQFLYEAGYALNGLIGITEPRRVAAVSMSKRVAMEMNLPTSEISYHIRYENNVTKKTSMKFMTDGVLTRELKEDFLLTKYSVIILDEAHERTSNTDVLIGLLSRIVPLRNKKGKPLKLIIMSATLRIEDFTENKRLFKVPPPVVKIDARQYPVTIHFNKKTPISDDPRKCPYINEAYKKICRIHRTLPSGGILVFVTGRQEVNALKKRLNRTFPSELQPEEVDSDSEDKRMQVNLDDYKANPTADDIEDDYDDNFDDEDEILDDDGDDEVRSDDETMMEDAAYSSDIDNKLPLHVLPLYALLAPEKQRQVFAPPPNQCRLCVVATNVAETSLTIPGIKYVIDTGKVKKKLYDKLTGVAAFRVTWISKASANQRAGRAGRIDSGHTYRLYSSAVFQDFPEHDEPEITSKPVAGLVLQMKSMKITRVINFPFPTIPSHDSLESAEKLLVSLGALKIPPCSGSLKQIKEAEFAGLITPLGLLISSFPVHPRFGKMIAEAKCHGDEILSYIITIVAALTVQEIFFTTSHDPDSVLNKDQARQMASRLQHLKTLWSSVGGGPERRLLGDLMVMLGAIGSAEFSESVSSFCYSNCLRTKAIFEIRKLRHQLTNVIKCVTDNVNFCVNPKMKPPNDYQVLLLRQIILSAMGDHVARKVPTSEIPEDSRSTMRGAYKSLLIEDNIYIHPDSVMSRDTAPDFVVFQEIIEPEKSKKTYMRDIMGIEPEWLASHSPHYCSFSKPSEEIPPRYDAASDDVKCHVTANYGRLSWPLGLVEISFPNGVGRYRWFACFLLQGEVIPSFKEFTPVLLSKPIVMVKTWAKLQPRTETLLRALISREVDSKEKLLNVWKKDRSYLKVAIMEWLPQSAQPMFLLSWPPEH